MEQRNKSIQAFYELMQTNSIESIQKSHNLYVRKHSEHDIMIVNYGRFAPGKIQRYTETDACRGLVISGTEPRNIISRGFDKFLPQNQNINAELKVTRATIKEDGSLIFMFKYQNKWFLSTMHDFADNQLPFSEMTYSELFLQIINQSLDEFAENLLNQFEEKEKDKIMTFCFEMCSVYNRVIRTYQIPTLFLLTIFGGASGSEEISIGQHIILPPNVKHLQEVKLFCTSDLSKSLSLEEATDIVIKLTANDFTFEGVVLQTQNNLRVKVKNPYYLIQHTLKYRGWVKATPQMMVLLILDGMDKKIVQNVTKCLGNDPIFEFEMTERIHLYTERIEHEYNSITLVVNDLVRTDFESKSEYMQYLQENYPNVFSVWRSLFVEIFSEIKYIKRHKSLPLNNVFKKHLVKNLDKIFTRSDYMLDINHPPHCCELTENNIPEDLKDFLNDGMSTSAELCYCGNKMNVVRLRNDLIRYRFCHCGKVFGYLTYCSGTYLGICTDKECLCTHEVNQTTLKPLGIPACVFCKNLRLAIHDMMDLSELTKSECYDKISEIIGKPKEHAHMAKLGISDCMKVLVNFNKSAVLL